MSSRPVPRTQIRKPKPTAEQLEKAFESVEDASPAPSLEVVGQPDVAVEPEGDRKKATKKATKTKTSGAADEAMSLRMKQTLYLSKGVRRALKLRAVDEECELSDLAERALRQFLGVY